ncbi:unnamed protein product [Cuscuta epithymum]|uniref:Uncharacterized protein n=1 Tax=Cuscuta epithymum TaxID=186058 RepID=A0AAV0DIH5_9ASTE|nr:unnamed protein product [Cuscuta epithymum]
MSVNGQITGNRGHRRKPAEGGLFSATFTSSEAPSLPTWPSENWPTSTKSGLTESRISYRKEQRSDEHMRVRDGGAAVGRASCHHLGSYVFEPADSSLGFDVSVAFV